jgi:Coenzyme PQQ synthesis protein D (PqqD)
VTVESIHISPEVIFREVLGEAILLNLKTERYLGLDEMGTRIWKLLETSGSVQSTFTTLLEEFEVQPGRLESDLREFIDKLIENGLITATGMHRRTARVPRP